MAIFINYLFSQNTPIKTPPVEKIARYFARICVWLLPSAMRTGIIELYDPTQQPDRNEHSP